MSDRYYKFEANILYSGGNKSKTHVSLQIDRGDVMAHEEGALTRFSPSMIAQLIASPLMYIINPETTSYFNVMKLLWIRYFTYSQYMK